jgi:RNA polymerase sigma factor (sigma-70 family)
MGVSSRGLFSFLTRLHPPPPVDSDADLLGRFVRTSDPDAFTGLMRRHGPMVLAVCQRRLGHHADAEDAFQAVFLALATSARSIRRPDALPGWLYRAAYQVALKAASRRARRSADPLPTAEVPMLDPPPAWETDELKALVDAEVAALPDKFRAVVVLCLIEGRSSADAAALLGVPVGTVDSRLSTARGKLRARLTRRGVSLGAGVTLQQMLGGPVEAAGSLFSELGSSTVPAVLAEAAATGTGAVSPAVIELSQGVKRMTTNLRVALVLGVALGVLGTAGAGIYFASAADPAQPGEKSAEQKPEPKFVEPQPTPPVAPPTRAASPPALEEGAAALLKPFGAVIQSGNVPMEDIFKRIEEQTHLVVRIDVAAFRRMKMPYSFDEDGAPSLWPIYNLKPVLPRRADKVAIRDILTDALAQVPQPLRCTYQVRGGQLLIVPAYMPPVVPGADPLNPGEEALVDEVTRSEQIYGGVVNVSADRQALSTILAELRKQTGANIVLDPRCETQDKKTILSVTLTDVRLYDALRVIADMADLKMVYAGNIYYVTTPSNASLFQPAPHRVQTPSVK